MAPEVIAVSSVRILRHGNAEVDDAEKGVGCSDDEGVVEGDEDDDEGLDDCDVHGDYDRIRDSDIFRR